MTFSKFHEHSSPIFKHLNIVKLPDLVFLNIAVFMYKFHNRRLPSVFDTFFTQVNKRHNYSTRSAWNMFYTLPKVKTNYGIFNIRLKGPKVWNSIGENLKTFSISKFKESVKSNRGLFCVRMGDRWTSDAWRLTTGFAFIKMARLKAIIAIILLVGLGECARDLTKCVVCKKTLTWS